MHENLQEEKKKKRGFDKIIVPKVPDRDAETLISFMILLLHLKQALRSWNGSIFLKRTPFFHHHPLKKKKKRSRRRKWWQVRNFKKNAVTSACQLKWLLTSFSQQNYQVRKKKKSCQKVGSGVLNHWSARILKSPTPSWKGANTFIGRGVELSQRNAGT